MVDFKSIIIGLFIAMVLVGTGFTAGLYLHETDNEEDIEIENDNGESSLEVETQINHDSEHMDVIQDSLDSVVTVYTDDGDELNSQGTGFIYNNNYIMTNEHVIDGGSNYYIQYRDGEWSEASLVGDDADTDIAILEPDTKPDYADPLFIDVTLPERGTSVAALGSPGGLESTVTTGIISGTERSVQIGTEFSIPDTIQTDAALNPGNSGGPLIDMETGTVVGINRATEGENIGFAVSSRMANEVAQELISEGHIQHSLVGIQTIELTPVEDEFDEVDSNYGLVVLDTFEDTPAHGQLETREEDGDADIIVGIDGREITDNEDLSAYIMRETSPGDEVVFTVLRDGEEVNITIEMMSREDAGSLG